MFLMISSLDLFSLSLFISAEVKGPVCTIVFDRHVEAIFICGNFLRRDEVVCAQFFKLSFWPAQISVCNYGYRHFWGMRRNENLQGKIWSGFVHVEPIICGLKLNSGFIGKHYVLVVNDCLY